MAEIKLPVVERPAADSGMTVLSKSEKADDPLEVGIKSNGEDTWLCGSCALALAEKMGPKIEGGPGPLFMICPQCKACNEMQTTH